MPMAKGLLDAIFHFRDCFSRERSFEWFEVIITGFLIRDDDDGLASFMRVYDISHQRYGSLVHFFESDAYSTEELEAMWIDYVTKNGNFPTIDDRLILLGDHTKSVHSGKYMPGVEKLADYSQNSVSSYVFAHLLGYTGIVYNNGSSLQCLPLAARIQHALGAVEAWLQSVESVRDQPNTIQMLCLLHSVVRKLRAALAVLDRAFLSEGLLIKLDELNNKAGMIDGKILMEVVTRCKTNVVAYPLDWEARIKEIKEAPKGPGRPQTNPESIKLMKLFDDPSIQFKHTTIERNGKKIEAEYYCINLLWGKNIMKELRFVLTKTDRGNAILVSTDLTLSPEDIMLAYFYRWQVETMFRDLKSEMGMCSYRFWSRSIDKLDRKNKVDRLGAVDANDTKKQQAILTTIDKYERHVLFANISYGIVTMLCADPVISKEIMSHVYQRTRKHPERATIAAARSYMRKWHFLISLLEESEGLNQFIAHLRGA